MKVILEYEARVVEVTIIEVPDARAVAFPCRVLSGPALGLDDVPMILRRLLLELARRVKAEEADRLERERAAKDLQRYWQDLGGEGG